MKEPTFRITIAGYGNIGQFVHQIFGGSTEIAVYDPPKQLGSVDDLRNTDYVFVCVPTLPLPGGACDTRAVEEVVALSEPRRAIICNSTIAVGTTERLIEAYGKPLVFIPEYAGEAGDHPYRAVENRNFFVLGGNEPEASYVKELFHKVYGSGLTYFVAPPVAAELVKYMENAFLALKVGFCNEFYDLCQAVGADYEFIRSMWLQDRRINPSHTRVTAERGYGGSCFPKDLASICSTARDVGTPMEILEALQAANNRHRSTKGPVESDLSTELVTTSLD